MRCKNNCCRCHIEIEDGYRWCDKCFYPGIDETYDEYRSLLSEGHRRIQAATMSGWEDPVEAGAYDQD